MAYSLTFRFLGFLFALLAFAPETMAGSRVALVVGNAAYVSADKLSNPVTDARNVRDALTKLGFQVIYGENLSKRDFERTIGNFAEPAQDADVALVYYAGHGATFGGTSYVVPIDAQFKNLAAIPYELIPVESLVGELRRARGVRIAILDACRDDSAEQDLKKGKSRGVETSRGLAPIKDAEGLILAYATQYLATAADGDPNGDSPFTNALLNNIATPGLDVKDLFFKVGREVVAKTGGRQRPEISVSFYEPFSLTLKETAPGPDASPAPDHADGAKDPEELAWIMAENSDSARIYDDFLQKYPRSLHRQNAEGRLASLESQTWTHIAGTSDKATLASYIILFPKGAHIRIARAQLAKLELGPLPSPPTHQRQKRRTDDAGHGSDDATAGPPAGSVKFLHGGDQDPTSQSFAVVPPHALPHGAVVRITSQSGRKMTCVGGSGDSVPRHCTWD